MSTWGYDATNGPNTWPNNFPAAGGKSQSPIDINTKQAEFDVALGKFKISYDSSACKELKNTGPGCQIPVTGDKCCIEGGPLRHKYRLVQFHFHWSQGKGDGSEHTVNGKTYPSELHLVHWNTELFPDAPSAMAADNHTGLAVLGIFIKSGKEHAGFKKITDMMKSGKIDLGGQTTEIPGGFDPSCLLPDDKTKYYTYNGSLTTPPCYESVLWTVFADPIEFSEEQLDCLRKLSTSPADVKKVSNYRPPCPLNGRRVFSSFNV